MTRTEYKNNHAKEHYDRINLCVPKGEKARIKAVTEKMNVSINEYIYMLICADLDNAQSRILSNKQGLTEEHVQMLDKWQIAQKYRDMIESLYIEEINGMSKHYHIILKKGYINDVTGSRNICTDKMHDMRKLIKASHKKG